MDDCPILPLPSVSEESSIFSSSCRMSDSMVSSSLSGSGIVLRTSLGVLESSSEYGFEDECGTGEGVGESTVMAVCGMGVEF